MNEQIIQHLDEAVGDLRSEGVDAACAMLECFDTFSETVCLIDFGSGSDADEANSARQTLMLFIDELRGDICELFGIKGVDVETEA